MRLLTLFYNADSMIRVSYAIFFLVLAIIPLLILVLNKDKFQFQGIADLIAQATCIFLALVSRYIVAPYAGHYYWHLDIPFNILMQLLAVLFFVRFLLKNLRHGV